jgi:hypothetical protein
MQAAARLADLTGTNRPDKPWLNGLPRMIFVSDMADSLSRIVPFDYLENEIIQNVISENGQHHIWMWLTKQPQRMVKFAESVKRDWPSNLWVGTSITTQKSVSRIAHLLEVGNEETVRFLSVEPQVAPIDVSQWPRAIRIRQVPKLPGMVLVAAKKKKAEKKTKAELSEIAKKAWRTRRENERKKNLGEAPGKVSTTNKEVEQKKKRSEAAYKAWRTRRQRQKDR